MDAAERDPDPAFDVADGFAGCVVAWARAAGAGDAALAAVRAAARRVSLAASDGHTCVTLAELAAADADSATARPAGAPDADVLRERLLESGVVAVPDGAGRAVAAPFVLDAAGRLYLHRYYEHERQLALGLLSMARLPAPVAEPSVARSLLEACGAHLGERQKLAVALALERRLTIISGGPGTGKTTTVVALLACLVAADPRLRIELAAPTGKAAARMLEAIRLRADALDPRIRERLPASAHTIHRLLGAGSRPGRFRHGPQNRLALDVLVVDEASMLDVAMASRLIQALPPTARLVLLGDKDQLAAVDAGAVFAELSRRPLLSRSTRARLIAATGVAPAADGVGEVREPAASDPETSASADAAEAGAALPDSVVWLTESRRFRADSGIGRLAADVNAGRGEAALARLADGLEPDVGWIDDELPALSPKTLAALAAGFGPYLDALARSDDPAAIFDAFDRFRVLCALREGPRGVAGLNRHARRMLHEALGLTADAEPLRPWYRGRPVIVHRNDHVLGLYNGDIGLCLPDAQGELALWFRDAAGGWRAIAPGRLPVHDTAFAITVHKSQGSEFEHAMLVLPSQPNRVATRELVYTAVTRAVSRVLLVASRVSFVAACGNPTRRDGGLLARLAEAR